jgi:aminoglycoside phosphotransferase (APT) family kinase protein
VAQLWLGPQAESRTMNIETSQLETIVSLDELSQLLQQTLGTKVELADYRIGNWHHDYIVLLVELRHPSIEVVVKLAGPEAPFACPFERTAVLHRLVATGTNIPMPEVLAVDTSYQTWPWRYFIRTRIPGQEWTVVERQMTQAERSNAYQQIGNAVAQLHTIGFSAFGEVGVDGSVQGDKPYLTALTAHARAIIKHARLRDLFLSVLEKQRALFCDVRDASLCHEDLHKHNILFQYRQGRWHLAAILDFDKAWAGHHETDLARLEFWRGMTSNQFWGAYQAIHPVEPLYEQRRPIYQLLWCLEFARPTAEHLADTQRLCVVELGLPRLEHFE